MGWACPGGRAARFAFLAQARGSVEDVEASSPAHRFVFSRESKGTSMSPVAGHDLTCGVSDL